jgi:hypothetical protein
MSESDNGVISDEEYEKTLEEFSRISARTVRINRLSERGINIVDYPELAKSIEDTDPIWNELYEFVNGISYNQITDEISIEEKVEVVRKWLFRDPKIDRLLSR